MVAVFFIVAHVTRRPRWSKLGIGLGIGITLHILLDLLLWFDGVEILWPIPSWINLWSGVTPPPWFGNLMMTAEFLFLAMFFLGLARLARLQGTNLGYLGKLRIWTWVQIGLLLIFTVLAFTLAKGFMTPYGLAYLLSLGLAIGVAIRMRHTVEFGVQS